MIDRNTRLGIIKAVKKDFREFFGDTLKIHLDKWEQIELHRDSGLKEFLEQALNLGIEDYKSYTTDNLDETSKFKSIKNFVFTQLLDKLVESFENLDSLDNELVENSELNPLFVIGGGVAFDEYSGWGLIGGILSKTLGEDFETIIKKLNNCSERINLFKRLEKKGRRSVANFGRTLKNLLSSANKKDIEHKILYGLLGNKDLEHIIFFSFDNLPDCYNEYKKNVVFHDKNPIQGTKAPLIWLMRGCLNKRPIYPHVNININKNFTDLIKSSFKNDRILIILDGGDISFDIRYIDNTFSSTLNDKFYCIKADIEAERSSIGCKYIYTSPSYALRFLFPEYCQPSSPLGTIS